MLYTIAWNGQMLKIKCPRCDTFMVKNGNRIILEPDIRQRIERRNFPINRGQKLKQRWICPHCKKSLENEDTWPRFRYSKQKIADILHRYYQRNTWCDLEDDTYINKEVMYRWAPYVHGLLQDKVTDYLKKGEYSGHWHIDRYEIDMRGGIIIKKKKINKQRNAYHTEEKEYFKAHLWSCEDNETKVILACHVSKNKYLQDCENFLKKLDGLPRPYAIVTDNEFGFIREIKEFFNKDAKKKGIPEVEHIYINKSDATQYKLWGQNNLIERYHMKIESKVKYRRRLYNVKTAQVFFWMLALHINFVKVHSTLGKTPVEQAGIGINYKGIRHMRDVIDHFVTDEDVVAQSKKMAQERKLRELKKKSKTGSQLTK